MIKVNNEVVKLDYFPDGTLNIKGRSELTNGIVVISWHYNDDEEFMAVALLTKWYQAQGNKVRLYMPYVPNARMDRAEEAGDIMTAKYFCEIINSLNYDKVYVLDVHSPVVIASLQNVTHIKEFLSDTVIEKIHSIEGEVPLLFFPDEGAMKRYSKNVNVPYGFGIKNREWSTGKILSYEVFGLTAEDVNGKNILIQDDICSKGGTFYYAAKKLKEMGANNIYLLVTHCENSIHIGEFGEEKVSLLETGLIKKVYTTDSIYSSDESEMVTVVKTGVKHFN